MNTSAGEFSNAILNEIGQRSRALNIHAGTTNVAALIVEDGVRVTALTENGFEFHQKIGLSHGAYELAQRMKEFATDFLDACQVAMVA